MPRRNDNARRKFIPSEQARAIEFGTPVPTPYMEPVPPGLGAFAFMYTYSGLTVFMILTLIFGAGLLRGA
jgi:hypothetical protein